MRYLLATFSLRVATFLGLHNQNTTEQASDAPSKVPRWKQLVSGVVSSVREKAQSLLGRESKAERLMGQHAPHVLSRHSYKANHGATATWRKEEISVPEPQEHTIIDIGHTTLSFSPKVKVRQDFRGIHIAHETGSFYLSLNKEGQLSEKSKEHLRKAGLLTHVTTMRTDFSHRIARIKKRERILAPGSIHFSSAHFPERDILQIEYRLVHSATSMPNALLITLDDHPDSPSYSFPTIWDDEGRCIVRFPSDAPKGSLERTIFDTCFSVHKREVRPLFHRAEFVSHIQDSDKKGDTAIVHAASRSKAPEKAPFPKIDVKELTSITIAPVSFPKLHGDALKKAQFDTLFQMQIREGLFEEWRSANITAFLEVNTPADSEEGMQSTVNRNGLLMQFYQRCKAAKYVITPGIQAWVLEHMPVMSVSEMHAFMHFDGLYRRKKLGRLFPVLDEDLHMQDSRMMDLQKISADSLDMNLLLGVRTKSGNKGMLMGDVLGLYPMFHQNLHEQKQFIDSYFLNQSPNISIERWVVLVNNAEEHFDEFRLIQNMTDEDYRYLESTSIVFQNLYQNRMHLKALMLSYMGQVDESLWAYLMASFDNTLERPQKVPSILKNAPISAECVRLAKACQEGMSTVSTRVLLLRRKLTRPQRQTWNMADFPVEYTLTPREPVGKKVTSELLMKETLNWIQHINTQHRYFEQKKFDLSPYNISIFRELIHRGTIIADSYRVSDVDPFFRKKVLGELYSNFLTSTSSPLLLSLYLEMFLQIAQHEKSHTTFIVTQVMLRKYISQLPESKKKTEIFNLYSKLQRLTRGDVRA